MKPLVQIFLVMALFSLSCAAPISGPVEVEVLAAGEGVDDFSLDVVELQSPVDLARGKGELFDFTGGMTVPALTLTETLKEVSGFDEMIEASREFEGGEIDALFRFEDGVYVAEDLDTLIYATSFSHFEDVFTFAQSVLSEDHPALQKGTVGFYGKVTSSRELPIPLFASDNAAYVALSDAWLVLPTVLLREGIPFAMNRGVIAHEFHHRVFTNAVWRESAFDIFRENLVSAADPDVPTEARRSRLLLQGLDEGLADVFAVAYTGHADFMSPSLSGLLADEALFRDLEGDYAQNTTYDALRESSLSALEQNHCGPQSTDIYSEQGFNFYCVGTVAAATLYETSGRDIQTLRTVVLPAVERALLSLGDALVASADGLSVRFDYDLFWELTARELQASPAQRAALCDQVSLRFASLSGAIASCL